MGLSAAARWAGYSPKNPPIAAAHANDNTTDTSDTLVVQANNLTQTERRRDAEQMPTIPPARLSASDSTRNCAARPACARQSTSAARSPASAPSPRRA